MLPDLGCNTTSCFRHLRPQLPYHDGLYPRNEGQNKPLVTGMMSYITARKIKISPTKGQVHLICLQEHEQPCWVRVAREDALMRVYKAKRCNIPAPAAVAVVSASLPWCFGGFCKERSGKDGLISYIGKLRGWRILKEQTQQSARLGTGRAVNLPSY